MEQISIFPSDFVWAFSALDQAATNPFFHTFMATAYCRTMAKLFLVPPDRISTFLKVAFSITALSSFLHK